MVLVQKGVTAVTMSPIQDALAAQTLCIWHHGPLKEMVNNARLKLP